MYITSIDNTNFQSLHASKKTLKAIGCSKKELLKNSAIRKAAEKSYYNEFVNPLKVVRLNEWNNTVDENEDIVNNL